MAFECRLLGVVRLSIFGRFVFLESAISIRFVWDFSEIWICGLYRAMDSPLNFPVLRFADVLLMQAEALNELGRSSEAAALASSENDGGPLNRVRVRAGLPNVTTTDQVELREIIRHERRMELAFEGGHRWFDLVRYDNDGEYAKTFFQSIGKTNFTTPKHLLLPVPIDDIDANPNLLPNNPGY